MKAIFRVCSLKIDGGEEKSKKFFDRKTDSLTFILSLHEGVEMKRRSILYGDYYTISANKSFVKIIMFI